MGPTEIQLKGVYSKKRYKRQKKKKKEKRGWFINPVPVAQNNNRRGN